MKSQQSCYDAIAQVLGTAAAGWTAPRLCLIKSANSKTTGLTAADLENPANWIELTGKGTTNRPDLSGVMPAVGAIAAGDGGSGKKVTLPTAQVTVTNMPAETCVALAIVEGTAALSASTKAR